MSDEKTFEEALRIQAVGAGTSTLTLNDVRSRARGIRRRRASVAAVAGAALVAAAVVPIALLAGGDSRRDALPPADATPTASDTANPVAASYPPGWIVGGEVRSSDGTAFTPELDGQISYLLRLGEDRWVLGVESDGDRLQVLVVTPTGEVQATYSALDGGLAADGRGTAVAWVGPDLRPRSLVAGADEPLTWDGRLVSNRTPAAPFQVLPGCDEEACQMTAELFGVAPGEDTTLVAASSDGGVRPLRVPGLLRVTDISPDATLASGYTSIDNESLEACSAVVEIESGEQLWETCEASSFRFSPDGSMVLATDAYLDGFGQSFVQVLSADSGELIQPFGSGTVLDYRWESDDAFLVSVQIEDGQHQLIRMSTEQDLQTVIEISEGTPGDPEGSIRLGR